MKHLSPWLRSRYLFALIGGLLLAVAFPKLGLTGMAWIAPAIIFASALGRRGGEAFRIGYVAGLAYALVAFYWLLFIPYRWHGIPLAPAAGWVALSAYLALYPATWVWLLSPKSKVQGPKSTATPHEDHTPQGSTIESPVFGGSTDGPLSRSWVRRTGWALTGAAAWVALEMLLTRLFSGFPWDLLGVSQYRMVPLLQVASFTGVYGISFLIIWVSLSLLSGALMVLRRPSSRSIWLGEIFLPILIVACVFNFGFHQLKYAPPPTRTLKVTLVQPSIPQTLIWDATKDEERFQDLIHLSEQALTNKTDLLVWPESGIPKLLRYDKPTLDAVTGLARGHRVWMIVGADDAEPRRHSPKPNDADFFNSSFLISPDGDLMLAYKKRSLVIFGEYIPLVRWLPFMKFFTPIPGGFTPGKHAVQFELPEFKAKISPLICFEDVFPQLARDCAEQDTDFLVNLTNDGWFDESAEPWQHASTGLFRAVENGLPLVRCTNNGLTCWIDAEGRVREIGRDATGGIYGPAVLTTEIPLLAPGQSRPRTFYNLHGDWFGWACVAIALARLGSKVIPRLQGSTKP